MANIHQIPQIVPELTLLGNVCGAKFANIQLLRGFIEHLNLRG